MPRARSKVVIAGCADLIDALLQAVEGGFGREISVAPACLPCLGCKGRWVVCYQNVKRQTYHVAPER